MTRKFPELEKALGIRVKDQSLLERALTHSSARAAPPTKAAAKRKAEAIAKGEAVQFDNERLEFLGDRVLGLAVAEMLIRAFPDVREGDLARQFNRLVRGEACADVAREIDLGPHLILADSEAENGGRDKDTILADAMEALLGAIFLSSGFEAARDVVQRLWGGKLSEAPVSAVDPKSALQEWAQGRGFPLPRYVEVARSGPDHAPIFIAEVRINGCEPAQGNGTSKRAAEQAAATALLSREGIWKGANHV